jgi:predicted  nucleic acid-binding Zn-ribbon protein
MSALEELLHLQEHDTIIDQLEHRLATLEERGALQRIEAALLAHDEVVAALEPERHLLVREQTKLEDNIQLVEEKRAGEQAKLYDGSVNAIKELQALQDEIESLKRRQSSLEDELIVILEGIEPLDERLAALAAERETQESTRAMAESDLQEAEREIRENLAAEQATRGTAVEVIPPETLAEYEVLRKRLRGVAVARMSGGSCMGCHLALSAVEVDRIRKQPPDAVVHCEECGRILVR